MKKMKKIVAAAMAMMTFSTAAAVTGTVAWFTSSNIVTASGMSIEADTEQGILIANELFSTPDGKTSEWNDSTVASHTGADAKFIPTSTSDTVTWYHANAAEYDNHAAGDSYTSYTGTQIVNNDGVHSITLNNISKNIYLRNLFHIKASVPQDQVQKTLYINKVEASVGTNSVELDKALRFVVVYNDGTTDKVKIYAPLETSTDLANYTVHNGVTVTPLNEKNVELATNVTIPGSETLNENTLLIKTFVYFEGEDVHCKSSNIKVTLDRLSITVQFGTEKIANN